MKIVRDYEGNDIRLTDERLRHILEHSEMANLEYGIEETIRYPRYVIESRTDANAKLYYRFFGGD